MSEEQRERLLDAYSDMGAALIQMIPSDDQIIRERVEKAYATLGVLVQETRHR